MGSLPWRTRVRSSNTLLWNARAPVLMSAAHGCKRRDAARSGEAQIYLSVQLQRRSSKNLPCLILLIRMSVPDIFLLLWTLLTRDNLLPRSSYVEGRATWKMSGRNQASGQSCSQMVFGCSGRVQPTSGKLGPDMFQSTCLKRAAGTNNHWLLILGQLRVSRPGTERTWSAVRV